MPFRKKDRSRGKIDRKSDYSRYQKKEQTDAVKNDNGGIDVPPVFLIDAVGIDNRPAGGQQ
jgi:hypothetical protein